MTMVALASPLQAGTGAAQATVETPPFDDLYYQMPYMAIAQPAKTVHSEVIGLMSVTKLTVQPLQWLARERATAAGPTFRAHKLRTGAGKGSGVSNAKSRSPAIGRATNWASGRLHLPLLLRPVPYQARPVFGSTQSDARWDHHHLGS